MLAFWTSLTKLLQTGVAWRSLGALQLYQSKETISGVFFFIFVCFNLNSSKLQCNESITYTTHGGFEFLDNLEPLLQRWLSSLTSDAEDKTILSLIPDGRVHSPLQSMLQALISRKHWTQSYTSGLPVWSWSWSACLCCRCYYWCCCFLLCCQHCD